MAVIDIESQEGNLHIHVALRQACIDRTVIKTENLSEDQYFLLTNNTVLRSPESFSFVVNEANPHLPDFKDPRFLESLAYLSTQQQRTFIAECMILRDMFASLVDSFHPKSE